MKKLLKVLLIVTISVIPFLSILAQEGKIIHSLRGDTFPYKSGYSIEEQNYIDIFYKMNDCDTAIIIYGSQIKKMNGIIEKMDKKNHRNSEKIAQYQTSLELCREANDELYKEFKNLSKDTKSIIDKPTYWYQSDAFKYMSGFIVGLGIFIAI